MCVFKWQDWKCYFCKGAGHLKECEIISFDIKMRSVLQKICFEYAGFLKWNLFRVGYHWLAAGYAAFDKITRFCEWNLTIK